MIKKNKKSLKEKLNYFKARANKWNSGDNCCNDNCKKIIRKYEGILEKLREYISERESELELFRGVAEAELQLSDIRVIKEKINKLSGFEEE